MSALNMSVKHGLGLEAAKANFAKGIGEAQAKYGSYIRQVDWSDDRTSARLSGQGFAVDLSVDADAVHAVGNVPFFVKFLEPAIRKFVTETFHKA